MELSLNKLVITLAACGLAFSAVAQNEHEQEQHHDKQDKSKSHDANKTHEAHWAYEGEHNAAHWGDMKPEFATCKMGAEQSPIDINTQAAVAADLPVLQTAYSDSILAIINNGHTVQVNYKGNGLMAVGADSYQLLQFHFHTPSEEKINGKAADMVAHFVHKNNRGELAVIALLLNRGQENAALANVMKNLPVQARGELLNGEITVPFGNILPSDHAYYTFKGSLTTPPCSEGVRWFVLKTPATLSETQLKAFTQIYPMNARPVQPLNARKIQQTR